MIQAEDIPVRDLVIPFAAILTGLYLYSSRKRKNFPPGPTGVPILGYIPFLGSKPFDTYTKLAKKYGDVYSLRLGEETWVILNGFDVIQEAFVTHGDVFSGRPQVHMYYEFTKGRGIGVVDYGPYWKDQRKFGLKTLKRFGFGNVEMEDMIAEEIRYLSDEIASRDGQSFNCHGLISASASNIICRMTLGKRFGYNDEYYNIMLKLMNAGFGEKLDGKLFTLMVLAPLTRFLPVFWSSYNRFVKSRTLIVEEMEKVIEEHHRTYDPNNTRDFIDEFIKEMEERKGRKSTFTDEQLKMYVVDLFVGGSETTTSTLQWILLCFATYPEVQEKVFQEIYTVIGDSRPTSLKDKNDLPYTNAFIHEIMRHRVILPTFLPHKTSKTIEFRGYTIPKDTLILANMWSTIFDPDVFDEPLEFRPERFINEEGKFVPHPKVIPFSCGPRYCLGEKLARAELFLVTTGLLQRFRIVADPSKPLPGFNNGIHAAVHAPHDFEIMFKIR